MYEGYLFIKEKVEIVRFGKILQGRGNDGQLCEIVRSVLHISWSIPIVMQVDIIQVFHLVPNQGHMPSNGMQKKNSNNNAFDE